MEAHKDMEAYKDMEVHKVVSHEEWIAARKAHLADEKVFTRARDALSRKRRELPWEKVEKKLCVRRSQRQAKPGRPVRRQKPADRLPLHAWSRLERRLPELFAAGRSFRRHGRPSRATRRRLRRGLTRPAATDRE